MKDYLQVANSPYMYIGVVLLLGIVCWQASVFISRSLKRAQALGITREKINKTVKVAALTSLVPSLAIVVALLTLAPVLGLPFSWTRLRFPGRGYPSSDRFPMNCWRLISAPRPRASP